MVPNQVPITAADLDALEALSHLVERLPTDASSFVVRPPYICGPAYRLLRTSILFWSPGRGWRLHIAWRAALAAKRAALQS